MPPLPEATTRGLAPFASLFSSPGQDPRATLTPRGDTGSWGAHRNGRLREMGLARECHFTNYYRVLNRVTCSAR
jgi:hypothetical protein